MGFKKTNHIVDGNGMDWDMQPTLTFWFCFDGGHAELKTCLGKRISGNIQQAPVNHKPSCVEGSG